MTKEKNINATAEQDKFADEILSDDEFDNVAGGTSGKAISFDFGSYVPKDESKKSNGFITDMFCTGK